MKFITLPFVVVFAIFLLANGYLCKFIREEQNVYDVSRSDLGKFNDQEIYLMLNGLDNLKALLNAAKLNSRVNSIACDVFRAKYGEYDVLIQDVDKDNYDIEEIEIGEKTYKTITINENQMKIDMLQYFGKCMSSLKIEGYEMSDEQSRTLNRMANEYASESLKSLKIFSVKKDTFEQYTRPWKEVENLTFTCFVEGLNGNSIMPFNQMFPKLKIFKAVLTSKNNYSFMNHYYPNLKSLDITWNRQSGTNHGNRIIDNLLRKNPKVKNVNL